MKLLHYFNSKALFLEQSLPGLDPWKYFTDEHTVAWRSN